MESNRLARIFFIFALILFVQSYVSENILPSIIGISVLSYVLFARSSFRTAVGGQDVEIKRTIAKKTYFADEPVNISISYSYPFKDNVSIKIVDRLPESSFVLEGSNIFDGVSYYYNSIDFTYELVRTKRGRVLLEGLDTVITDKRGLFYVSDYYELEGEMTYLDSRQNIQRADAIAKGSSKEDVVQEDLTLASGMLYAGIRDYQPGDKTSDIDWKASSRLLRLLTKLSESEKYGNIYIILDASRTMRATYRNMSKFNHSILLSMQLAKIFIEHDTPTGFVAFDEHVVIDAVHSSYNRDQYKLILDSLDKLPETYKTTYFQAPNYEQSDLDPESKVFLSKIMPYVFGTKRSVRTLLGSSGFYSTVDNIIDNSKSKAMMIILSDLESQTKTLLNTLRMVSSRGHDVILITPYSPWYDMGIKDMDMDVAEKLYENYLVKSKNISMLKSVGVKIIEETPYDSIDIIYPKIAGEMR